MQEFLLQRIVRFRKRQVAGNQKSYQEWYQFQGLQK